MDKMKKVYWAIVLMLLLGSVTARAEWSEPVYLEELGEATTPCLSSDGLTIYFRRNIGGNKRLVEAYRDTVDGLFTSERVITELSGGKLYSPWISADGLRLYYARDDGEPAYTRIIMAQRDSTDDLWSESMVFSGIHINGTHDKYPALTGDELTMFYSSDRSGEWAIWKTTRNSIGEQFSNPTMVGELSSDGTPGSPSILPDGLTIYFHVTPPGINNGDLYRATRPSTDEAFGNFERLGVSTETFNEGGPFVTTDEQGLYFYSSRGEEGVGIWFSSWIHDPHLIAIENIEQAIALKMEAIELVNLAIEREQDAFSALNELRDSGELGELSMMDIFRARLEIVWAMGRQINAKFNLRRSIIKLERALRRLTLESEPEGEGPVHPERPVRPRPHWPR